MDQDTDPGEETVTISKLQLAEVLRSTSVFTLMAIAVEEIGDIEFGVDCSALKKTFAEVMDKVTDAASKSIGL
jgi:hypothetical protein